MKKHINPYLKEAGLYEEDWKVLWEMKKRYGKTSHEIYEETIEGERWANLPPADMLFLQYLIIYDDGLPVFFPDVPAPFSRGEIFDYIMEGEIDYSLDEFKELILEDKMSRIVSVLLSVSCESYELSDIYSYIDHVIERIASPKVSREDEFLVWCSPNGCYKIFKDGNWVTKEGGVVVGGPGFEPLRDEEIEDLISKGVFPQDFLQQRERLMRKDNEL